jgi:hypothetical protein
MILTSGAMAIAARAINQMGLAAFFTLVEDQTAGFGTTADDGPDDLAVYFRYSLIIALQVLGTKGSKDLIDGGHGLSPPSPD